jgi:hypothetical protein
VCYGKARALPTELPPPVRDGRLKSNGHENQRRKGRKLLLKRAYSDASAVTSRTYSILRSARRFDRRDENLQIHRVRNLRGSAKSWQKSTKSCSDRGSILRPRAFLAKSRRTTRTTGGPGCPAPPQKRPPLYSDALFKYLVANIRFDTLPVIESQNGRAQNPGGE